MIFKPEFTEAFRITKRALAALMTFKIISNTDGANLRAAVGNVLANFHDLTVSQTIGTELQKCFPLATTAGATLESMDKVRLATLAEVPKYSYGSFVVNALVLFSLSEQSQMISTMTFASRIEADALIDRMMPIFEDVRIDLAESFSVGDYQNMVKLSAALIQHLSSTERQLPRVVSYKFPVNYPALALSNRIYGDGSRSDELIAENEVVHPAFCPRDVLALSV